MQILLNDDSFTVRYWDWTVPENRDALFKRDRLGESGDDGRVTGDLMSEWFIVCAFTTGQALNISVCNPTITPADRNVYRCGEADNCFHSGWPDQANVERSLRDFDNYRTSTDPQIANKHDKMSFSNHMEGFANDDNPDCDNIQNKKDQRLLCGKEPFIRRRLHNLVRHVLKDIYLFYYEQCRFTYCWVEQ